MIRWLEQFMTIARKSFTVFLGDAFSLLLNLFFLGATVLVASLPGFTFGEQVKMLRDQLAAMAFSGGCLAAALGGAYLISEDIRSGMVPVIMSRPVRPSAFIFGRWAGLLGVLALLTATACAACLWATRLVFKEQWIETLGVAVYLSVILLALVVMALRQYVFKGIFVWQANIATSVSFIAAFLLLNFVGYDGRPAESYGALVDWKSIYLYIYIFMALTVFSAIICCFSVVFDQSLLMIFAVVVFFGGLLSQFFTGLLPAGLIHDLLQAFLPNWQAYWAEDRLGHAGIGLAEMLRCLVQSLGLAAAYLVAGTILFKRREISGKL